MKNESDKKNQLNKIITTMLDGNKRSEALSTRNKNKKKKDEQKSIKILQHFYTDDGYGKENRNH